MHNHKFKNRYDGFNQAKKSWTCKNCNTRHHTKKDKHNACPQCNFNDFYYCASEVEANRLQQLLIMQKAGYVRNVRNQVPFRIDVNGQHIGKYYADFSYTDVNQEKTIYEDTKGGKGKHNLTDLFQWKRKLVKAIYNVDIRIVTA